MKLGFVANQQSVIASKPPGPVQRCRTHWLVSTTEVYSELGADIVMESLTRFEAQSGILSGVKDVTPFITALLQPAGYCCSSKTLTGVFFTVLNVMP